MEPNAVTMNHSMRIPDPQLLKYELDGDESMRILVVEDNKDTAMSLMTLLVMKGFMVHNAYDGLSAITVAESFHPDVVFLDIGLPGINGHEVARRIRASAGGKDVRMIAITAWGDDEHRQRSADVGCECHLVKPVRMNDIMKVLAK